ncbi:MAG: TetR/AcrR family transcriptional regulator [Thermoleophilum sp.]|nr:TetR/AcrR family transcriptional regulator [Thermoleophilum sp.]
MVHYLVTVAYKRTADDVARSARTRARILAAALAAVREGGFAAASVRAVALRAGVSVGCVYRHFHSKGHLLEEVFRTASERELAVMTETARARASSPVAERLAACGEAFARRALAAPRLAYALIAEPAGPEVDAARLELRRGYRDVIASVLREGIARGELDPHDCEVMAAALVGAIAEALVGPLAAETVRASGREALVAALVGIWVRSLPLRDRHRRRPPRSAAQSRDLDHRGRARTPARTGTGDGHDQHDDRGR